MKGPTLAEHSSEDVRIQRIRYEPSTDKYILAYSDESNPRVANPEDMGDLADSAVRLKSAPEGALAAPLVAQIAVTKDCNLTCKFCYAELSEHRQDRMMTTQQVKDVIDDLQSQGVIYLEWAGGEPLIREDFVHLMRYAYECNFKQSIITNGTHFSEEFLRYGPPCLKTVQISIDDVDEHYNRVKGGDFFEALTENVRRGIRAGLPVLASIVVTESNAVRLERIVEYVHRCGFESARICWQIPLGEASGQSLAEYRKLVSETVSMIRSLQRQYAKRGLMIFSVQDRPVDGTADFLPREYLLCSAARTRLHIDWDGSSYACPLLKYEELKAGNVVDEGVEKVWYSKAFDSIRDVKNGSTCASCKLYCSYWCRAIVYGFTREMATTPSPICHVTWKGSKSVPTPDAP